MPHVYVLFGACSVADMAAYYLAAVSLSAFVIRILKAPTVTGKYIKQGHR